jgi:hypothetical protein
VARQGPGRPRRWMAAHDRIRLTGLLRKSPASAGLFYCRLRRGSSIAGSGGALLLPASAGLFYCRLRRGSSVAGAVSRRGGCAVVGDTGYPRSRVRRARSFGVATLWIEIATRQGGPSFESQTCVCGGPCRCRRDDPRRGRGSTARAVDEGPRDRRTRHHPIGRVRQRPAARPGLPAGEDVRRADAAVQPGHQLRSDPPTSSPTRSAPPAPDRFATRSCRIPA